MSQVYQQAVGDVITYTFEVGELGVTTVASASATSDELGVTAVGITATTVSFIISSDSMAVNTRATLNLRIVFSSGDIENKVLPFLIIPMYVH